MSPLDYTDSAVRALEGEALSDFYAAVEAAEIRPQRPISMAASALWYATTLNWPVFPLKPRGKKPITPHGFKDATIDRWQVESWWEQYPDANIGVPTGPDGIGLDVLDIDGTEGVRAWARIRHASCPPGCADQTFCDAPGPFHVHARAFTPGNGVDRAPGRHLYIPATGKGNTAGIAGQPLDYRGAGGYVVAPPSVGLSGARYMWLDRPAAR